jgi:hypothetical protein
MNTKTPPEPFNQLQILINKGDSASYHLFFWTTDNGLQTTDNGQQTTDYVCGQLFKGLTLRCLKV